MRAQNFKHSLLENHIFLTALLSTTVVTLWLSFDLFSSREFLFSALGITFGISYFAMQHNLQEVQFFKALFSEFNKRYDALNSALNTILLGSDDIPLTNEERLLLFDYFNLSGEEFLYYRKGFIYPEIWESWHNGMKAYCASRRIRELWKSEIESGSYYGFKSPCEN